MATLSWRGEGYYHGACNQKIADTFEEAKRHTLCPVCKGRITKIIDINGQSFYDKGKGQEPEGLSEIRRSAVIEEMEEEAEEEG